MIAFFEKIKNTRYLLVLEILIVANFFSALYMFLPTYINSRVAGSINKQLARIQSQIQAYIKEYSHTPDTFVELGIYSKFHKHGIDFYDVTGQAFQYIKLSSSHYFVRSFGLDGVQNTIYTSKDLLTAHWNSLDVSSPKYKYQNLPTLKMFAAPILLGMSSSDDNWHAQIYFDISSGKRQLLVRNKKLSSFVMLAFHDFVEEFFWMPDSQNIVFTATSSLRYPDGIYLWNIKTDKVINLINNQTHANIIGDRDDIKRYYLSLSGVNQDGKNIYAYIYPQNELSISPKDFFSFKSLYRININLNGVSDVSLATDRIKILSLAYLADNPRFSSTPSLMLDDEDSSFVEHNKIYRYWKELPLGGEVEKVLDSWQNFSNGTASTLIFPYCLWYLSVLYSDAFRLAIEKNVTSADSFRALGLEIARSLSGFIMAPSYLRAFGLDAYQTLVEGHPLNYRLSNMHFKPQVKRLK